MNASTFTTMRSIFCSTRGLRALTVTDFRLFDRGFSTMVVNSLIELSGDDDILKGEEYCFSYPTADTTTRYLPCDGLSNEYRPSWSDTDTFTTLESFAFKSVIVAADKAGWLVAPTFPLSFTAVLFCALPMKDTVNSMIINRLGSVLMALFLVV